MHVQYVYTVKKRTSLTKRRHYICDTTDLHVVVVWCTCKLNAHRHIGISTPKEVGYYGHVTKSCDLLLGDGGGCESLWLKECFFCILNHVNQWWCESNLEEYPGERERERCQYHTLLYIFGKELQFRAGHGHLLMWVFASYSTRLSQWLLYQWVEPFHHG